MRFGRRKSVGVYVVSHREANNHFPSTAIVLDSARFEHSHDTAVQGLFFFFSFCVSLRHRIRGQSLDAGHLVDIPATW